jgi:regulator of protease activity HflC (stomatin/prohibitin superfamily)
VSYALSWILGILFFPITILGSWVVVHPQEEAVVMMWGKLRRIYAKPGLYWCNMWGRKVIKISTKKQAIDIPRSVVADGNGNPIVVAGVVTHHFVDSRKAALEVEDAGDFVKTQALAVLKQLCSRYPYESKEGESLKSEADEIGGEMVRLLQAKVDVAGAEVQSFELSDLTYAPEIAGAMLVRQQAQALVDARKTIVEGAVEIVAEAVEMLEERGLGLPATEQPRMVSNLLTVICGDSNVQPMLPVGASPEQQSGEPNAKIEALLETIAKHTKPA